MSENLAAAIAAIDADFSILDDDTIPRPSIERLLLEVRRLKPRPKSEEIDRSIQIMIDMEYRGGNDRRAQSVGLPVHSRPGARAMLHRMRQLTVGPLRGARRQFGIQAVGIEE
jgi:hypothetical protein